MRTKAWKQAIIGGTVLSMMVIGGNSGPLGAKERTSQYSSNEATGRLYNLLDSKFNGKLEDFCVLADLVSDPKNAGQSLQRVLRVEYHKDMKFGRLNIRVRAVAQLTPDQLKAYNAKAIYDFAESDVAKFTKTDPGTFGKPGDVYIEQSADGGAMGSVPVTSEIQEQYDKFVTQYVLPALEKQSPDSKS